MFDTSPGIDDHVRHLEYCLNHLEGRYEGYYLLDFGPFHHQEAAGNPLSTFFCKYVTGPSTHLQKSSNGSYHHR